MIKSIKNFIFFAALLFFFTEKSFSQEYDIVSLLKKVEEGKSDEVREALHPLMKRNPGDPSLLFLSALLTEDGTEAKGKYLKIVNTFPNSKYADAALFRIFSYYTAIGNESEATLCLDRLKVEYPNSNYLPQLETLKSIKQEEIKKEDAVPNKSSSYKFTIQVGAFSSLKNAESLKNDLLESGYEVELSEKNVAGTIFNVVCLGKFADNKSAEKILTKVNYDFRLNGRIIPLDK